MYHKLRLIIYAITPIIIGNIVTSLFALINAHAKVGFAVEALIEETDQVTLERDTEHSTQYYIPCRAKKFPLSFIIKAIKL